MGSKFLGLNVRFVHKIKKICRLKLGLVIQDELRAGSCYFLYLISGCLHCLRTLAICFSSWAFSVNQHVMGGCGHMFVDLFLTPIKNTAVAVILISTVRPFAYPVN